MSFQIENYMLACGMSSIGIVSCGGVGRAVAEWITEGKTSLDFSDFDVKRFGKIHTNPDFLANRASEILGKLRLYSSSFSLRVAKCKTNFLRIKYLSLFKGARTCHLLCKRPKCYHSTSRHMWETGSLNWAQFMLKWFIRFPEFAVFTEYNESSGPFRKNSIEFHGSFHQISALARLILNSFAYIMKRALEWYLVKLCHSYSPCRNINHFGHLRFIKHFWQCPFNIGVYGQKFFLPLILCHTGNLFE